MLDPTVVHYVTLIGSGMFLWDYLSTLWLEYKLIRGQMKLRWPLIPYFFARYASLGFVIACLLYQASRQPVDCDAIYISGNLLGKVAVTSASVNLAVRTAVIWSYKWYILLLLGVLVTGQVILIGIGLRDRGFFANWSFDLQHCVGSNTSRKSDLGVFAPYAVSVDCVIVILTAIRLRKFDPKTGFAALLIRQGIFFFFLVLSFQTFVAVTVFTKDNDILVSISSVLCAIIVPMVSCHLVRVVLTNPCGTPRLNMQESSTIAGECLRGDGVQLTTHVELGSRTSSSSC